MRQISEKDKRLFAAAALFILGFIILAISLAASAVFAWLGVPRTTSPTRLVLFLSTGVALCLTGFRWASGTWHGSAKPLLQACGIAGVLFLGDILRVNSQEPHRMIPPLWLLLIMELPLLWLLIAKRKPCRRGHKKRAENARTLG